MGSLLRRAYLFSGLILIFAAGNLMAEAEFSFDGQIRLRSEIDLKSTETARHARQFNDLRTRIGLKFEPTDQVFVYVQLQDSRRLGFYGSGHLNRRIHNVDLHQAYFVIHNTIINDLHFKAGRFELNYGNQRVFGSVGWHNVGRSWEGGILTYKHEKLHADLFMMKRRERDDRHFNRDFDIIGMYGKMPDVGLDLFGFYEYNADKVRYVQERLKQINLGTYYKKTLEAVDIEVQGVMQLGEKPRDRLPDSTVQDISAFMFAAEVGYSFDTRIQPRFAIGVDYTSGDDGADSTKYKSYTNAYLTGHKFRGYMDLFESPKHGLIDLMLRGKANLKSNWLIKGDIHYFKAAEDYLSLSDSTIMTTNLGIEFDLTVVHKSVKGVTVTGGSSFFLADEHFSVAGEDRKNGVWAYLMTTINF
jgi:hypothetical protein